tara:strand:- start:224 stop:511 length:288 start_codon:yes stop_codon:yes gene_type:complete
MHHQQLTRYNIGDNMAKKKESKLYKLNFDNKEYEFEYESLTKEAQANYSRANEIAASMMRAEQQVSEQRWLLNKYISFVVGELDIKKELDDKEEK